MREFLFTRKPHPTDKDAHVITVETKGGVQTDLRIINADDPGTVPVVDGNGNFVGWRK
jgi:hypothetical protein